jgi:CBS domain-containing protein
VPTNDFAGLGVLPAFMLLGVGCGVLAIVISRGLFFIESIYRRLPIHEFWHPAIGAVGFAVIGLFVPRVLGVGYDVIGDLLAARIAVGTAAVIAIAKLGAWWLALGSGTSGGTLAPVLMISAAFGLVLGTGLNHVLPGPDVAVGAFAVVAMAATFGAATQATFTAMVFVFELTRDYDVVLPMMLATVIADLIYSAVNDESLMTEKLRRRGLNVTRHYGVDPFSHARVSEIMTTGVAHLQVTVADDDDVVAPGAPAEDVLRILLDESIEHVPVVDHGNLVGIVTRADLFKVRRRQLGLEEREPGALGRRRAVAARGARVRHRHDG